MTRVSLRATQESSPERTPTQDLAGRAARGTGPSRTWRVVGALARLEGRKLIRHPIFLAGVGFALLGGAIFVAEAVREPAVSWEEDGWTVFIGFGLLGLLTMLAASYVALRDRRSAPRSSTIPCR